MRKRVRYGDIAAAVADTGMIARGGFVTDEADHAAALDTACVVMIGNIGGAIWPHFERQRRPGRDPLDRWTRASLQPIANRFGATFVHPSDQPYQPFQRWAQRADLVWQSPIGLLIHPTSGLWHAYRGALLFPEVVEGLPIVEARQSPCMTCVGQPCLTTCPVDAFTAGGYDSQACREHVRSGLEPTCLSAGCAARLACPIGVEHRYGADQMRFHMAAFAGVEQSDP